MDIRQHGLAWRWTDEKYTVLPAEVLAGMVAVEPREAERLFHYSFSFNSTSEQSLDSRRFAVTRVSTAVMSREAGCQWLRQRHADLSTPVVLSWQPTDAVRTSWGTFTAYWDTFCYPASDDLTVWPEDEAWVVLYHHDEEFHFGQRNGQPSPAYSRVNK